MCVSAEGPHPYRSNMDARQTVDFPRKQQITISFAEQCKTESGYDKLTITSADGFRQQLEGSGRWNDLVVPPTKQLKFHFVSDGSTEYWGWRCECRMENVSAATCN